MLPDTIHKLPESERFAYARVLAAIDRSDDEITIEEMAMFEQRLGTALLSPGQRNVIRQSLKSDPIPLPELLEDIGPEGGKLALRDAVMMAAVDGNVDDDERANLDLIAKELGISDESVEKLLAWTMNGYAWMQEGFDLLESL